MATFCLHFLPPFCKRNNKKAIKRLKSSGRRQKKMNIIHITNNREKIKLK